MGTIGDRLNVCSPRWLFSINVNHALCQQSKTSLEWLNFMFNFNDKYTLIQSGTSELFHFNSQIRYFGGLEIGVTCKICPALDPRQDCEGYSCFSVFTGFLFDVLIAQWNERLLAHFHSLYSYFRASTGLFLAAFQSTEATVENIMADKIKTGKAKCHHWRLIRSEYFSRYCCVK